MHKILYTKTGVELLKTDSPACRLLEKYVAGSTQNQQSIVGRGCCSGSVGPVRLQQRVVDRFLLIRPLK